MIIQERLEEIARLGLKTGSHNSLAEGACAMEAASYIAGEPWSDHPECVSSVIGAFLRSWNDSLSSEDRAKFITPELIAKTIGTKGSEALERKRSLMAADWLIRTHTPAWLRLAQLDKQAELIESLPLSLVESVMALSEQTQIDMVRQIVAQWSMFASGHDQILDGLDFIESEIRREDDAALSGRADMLLGLAA